MGIQLAAFEDNMRLTLDVWNQELRPRGQCRGNAVNRAIPVGRSFLCTVTSGNHLTSGLKITAKARVPVKIDQPARLGKG